jgi:hypothetical protein
MTFDGDNREKVRKVFEFEALNLALCGNNFVTSHFSLDEVVRAF